jgi:hypothetical protein
MRSRRRLGRAPTRFGLSAVRRARERGNADRRRHVRLGGWFSS